MDSTMRSKVHAALLLGVPFLLAVLLVMHPLILPNSNAIEAIAPKLIWWNIIHFLGLILFSLLGISVYLLTNGLSGRLIIISRIAILFYMIFYCAYEAITGIGVGVLVGISQEVSSSYEFRFADLAVHSFFWGPVVGLIATIGSLAWLTAIVCVALALKKNDIPQRPFILLIISGVALAISRGLPFGTIAMGCFFAAAFELQVKSLQAPAKGKSRVQTDDSAMAMLDDDSLFQPLPQETKPHPEVLISDKDKD